MSRLEEQLTAQSRARLASEARLGRLPAGKFHTLALLTDVTGRHCAPRQIRPRAVTVCPRGDLDGLRAHGRTAFVLAEETVARFRFASPQELVRWLAAMDVSDEKDDISYVDFDDLASRQSPRGGRAGRHAGGPPVAELAGAAER